jgi:hypothetical protein
MNTEPIPGQVRDHGSPPARGRRFWHRHIRAARSASVGPRREVRGGARGEGAALPGRRDEGGAAVGSTPISARSSPFALRQAQEAQDEDGWKDAFLGLSDPDDGWKDAFLAFLILSFLSLSKGEG